ncbi:uncharacterized protein PAC_05417 [Phialocephala subalpina]|uniref:2EXR domain-containing protein n=1 Tax=Phialocephala subalpina TaxID=576137 RepID=A0A1L7WRY9_9HELO|nr:uncharacterized protein PAC_05417 [Phialocephala subalpina]
MAQPPTNPSTQSTTLPTTTSLSPSTTATIPDTFHPFPRLPAELKLKVWKEFNEVESRIVKVTFTRKNEDPVAEISFKLLSPTPSILHVCHDSCAEGLKLYPVTAFNTVRSGGATLKEIYVNPHLDTLIFRVPEWAQRLDGSRDAVDNLVWELWVLSDEDYSFLASGPVPLQTDRWARETHSLVQVRGRDFDNEDDTSTTFLVVLPHEEQQVNDRNGGIDYKDSQSVFNRGRARREEAEEAAIIAVKEAFPNAELGGTDEIAIGLELHSWDGLWEFLLDGVQELC